MATDDNIAYLNAYSPTPHMIWIAYIANLAHRMVNKIIQNCAHESHTDSGTQIMNADDLSSIVE